MAGREDLLEKLWDDQTYVDENTLNVNITRVRKKFEAVGIKGAVETVRGAGYRLTISWLKAEDNEAIFKRACSINCSASHSIFAILAIYFLDGYRQLLPALYSVFLGLFFLGVI